MKTWYHAVCDTHGEAIDIFVSNIACTTAYLSDANSEINDWMATHFGCELRLVWRDDQLDKLWDEGYKHDFTEEGRKLGRFKRMS